MSDFTADRFALLVDENGGQLVRTPVYGVNENTAIRKIAAALDEQATLSIKATTVYGGSQQDDIHGMINNLSKDKVKEYLHEELDFATYEVTAFDYKESKSSNPLIEEKLDIQVSNYATMSGRRLFILPNVMTRSHRKMVADENRKFPVVLNYAYTDIDSVEINIPAGYTAESMPQEVSLDTRFGKYRSKVKLEADKLIYYRSMQAFSGRFEPAAYNELVKFYETIYKADRSRVVLVKNEQTKGF